MKHFILILTFLPFFTFCGQQKGENTEQEINSDDKISETIKEPSKSSFNAIYYLIRHAEKVRTDPKNEDPKLNEDGMARAKTWEAYFKPIQIDEIYTTDFLRTKQTVSNIAKQKKMSPQIYNQNTIYSDEFLRKTNGKSVLIVGHSNTIPFLVNKLINEEKYIDMDDGDNSTLFKVTIDGEEKKVETITVE